MNEEAVNWDCSSFFHDLYFFYYFFLLLYHTIKMYEEGFILFRPGGVFFERKLKEMDSYLIFSMFHAQ